MQTAHHASGVALHAANAAHNAAGREQLAQQAAAAAAEREHLVTQQAREVISQMTVQTAQNEEVLRAQAHAIASAAQSALSDAQVREESLRAQAQQALQQADAMAHRQLAEARAEVSRVEAARAQAEGAWHVAEDARQRAERRSQELQLQVDTADTRTRDLESQVAALKRKLASTQADALARVQALTGQLLHAREQGFEVFPPTPALVSSPTIPEDAPFVFTQPSPDQSPNGTVSFPQQSTLSVPAGMGFQTAPSDAQPSDQHTSSEGAAYGVPVHVAQFASPVNPPVDNALERRVDDLASLVKNLAGLVAKGFAAHPGEQPAQGAASQGAPATQSGAAPSAAVTVPTLSLGATNQQAGGNKAPESPGSSSSSSSSSSASSRQSRHNCRMCGSRSHHEADCPHLTANGGDGTDGDGDGGQGGDAPGQGFDLWAEADRHTAESSSTKGPAEYEETVIRLKSLNDLVLPAAPETAGQARGYINQVLVAIGRLQKTPGNEVYQWAQACLTSTDAELAADPSFPRLQREIAAKLLKVVRKGRFGLQFQQMVERERMGAACCASSSNTFSWNTTASVC